MAMTGVLTFSEKKAYIKQLRMDAKEKLREIAELLEKMKDEEGIVVVFESIGKFKPGDLKIDLEKNFIQIPYKIFEEEYFKINSKYFYHCQTILNDISVFRIEKLL